MEHIWTMLMHKILQNHLLCAFVANLKIGAICALYPESFCDKNLAIRKVYAFCDSAIMTILVIRRRTSWPSWQSCSSWWSPDERAPRRGPLLPSWRVLHGLQQSARYPTGKRLLIIDYIISTKKRFFARMHKMNIRITNSRCLTMFDLFRKSRSSQSSNTCSESTPRSRWAPPSITKDHQRSSTITLIFTKAITACPQSNPNNRRWAT